MALIGKIVAITGSALLISNNGDQRDLRLGDNIQTADTIKTLAGVEVELALANGRVIHIGAEQLVAFADELGDVFVPEASDSAIDVATIDTVIKAIEEGKDINEVLEDTAAGVGGSSNSYGFGFVDLLRINDDLNNFRFVFDSSTTGRLEAEPVMAVAETVSVSAEANVVAIPSSLVGSVSSPTTTEGGNLDYIVTLSNASTSVTTVTLTPASGTGTLGADTTTPIEVSFDSGTSFTTVVGSTVSVPAGVTSFITRIPTVNDTTHEIDETITLSATTPQNVAPVIGTGTIVDNDDRPVFNMGTDFVVDEAAGTISFTVTKTGATDLASSVNFTTVDGTA
ncbi:MAG: retention module-containing protein, partial [Methylotenera sp.]|nr:retention module-containing protein [Methylotenera sp.]